MPLSSSRLAIACLLVAAGTAGCDRQTPDQGQGAPANVAASTPAVAPVTGDEVTGDEATGNGAAPVMQVGVDRSHRGAAAPTAAFSGPDGKLKTLADFRGKPVLVNLWATWCGPCVAELPTLNAAAAAFEGKAAVIAISQDTQNIGKVPAFLADHGGTALVPYVDRTMALSLAYAANLPTTILFDARGREVWRWHGGNDWSSAAARKLIAEAG